MDLLGYFRVLRRRWALIGLLAIVGGALGYASTLLERDSVKERTYYKATSTLQLDTSSSSSGDSSTSQPYSSVEQISVIVTTGDVPNAVAKALGSSETGRQLAEHIVTLTNTVPSTLKITAADADSRRAAALADGFADQLVKELQTKAQARYDKANDDLNKQLAQLRSQANGFLNQIKAVPPPPDIDTIQKQYDATQNQYYTYYAQLQALTTAGVPQSGLTKIESAESIPISKSEYDSRLSLGASGQNNLRAENSAPDGIGAIDVSSSSAPSLDDPLSRTLLGAFLGLLAGVGLALVLNRLDRRIRTRNEAETAYGVPVLAEVPTFTRAQVKDRDIVTVREPLSRAAEAYRAIRTSLLFQQASVAPPASEPPKTDGNGNGSRDTDAVLLDSVFEPEQHGRLVIMVTSASPREGKTNTSANLAAVFAEAGASVLIVNCDFRRPTIHRLLNVDDLPRTVQSTPIPGVKVVTNVLQDPNANPSQVVAAQRQVIAAARSRFDVIILDTAPILTANDAIEVVGSADLVLLIARADVTTTDKAERTMEILTRLEAPIGGIVLVGSVEGTTDYYYYYQRNRVQSSRKRAARRSLAEAPTQPPSPLPTASASDVDAGA
jgi:Mrp family chromosome partitioning ATPase/capsular polysaccharide biosynthesis protein